LPPNRDHSGAIGLDEGARSGQKTRPDTVTNVPLVAAAICPHPPILVPELASGAAPELEKLRDACRKAISYVRETSPDAVIVVGGDTRTIRHAPPYGGSFLPWGVDLPVGAPGGDPLPLSLLVGAWLAPEASGYVSVAAGAPPDECAALGEDLAADGRIGLVVMGDASACRSEKAPGYFHPDAAAFDANVSAALAGADAEALLAIDPAAADRLHAAGRAPWQVVAGSSRTTETWKCTEVLYDEAPYGVGYLVASWR
jgi:hypothetical protein